MNDIQQPAIITSIELPDPEGHINDDFKRGACYVARMMAAGDVRPTLHNLEFITIPLPDGTTIECNAKGKPLNP